MSRWNRYIAGDTKWHLKDLHIISDRVAAGDSIESIRDSKVALLRGDSSSGEWSLPFPMSIAIKAAEVDRPTNPTSQPTRWITAIRIYAACSAACTVHRKWSHRARTRAFRGTVREVTSLVVVPVDSHQVSCLRISTSVYCPQWYLSIYFRVGADRPNANRLLLLRDAKRMLFYVGSAE